VYASDSDGQEKEGKKVEEIPKIGKGPQGGEKCRRVYQMRDETCKGSGKKGAAAAVAQSTVRSKAVKRDPINVWRVSSSSVFQDFGMWEVADAYGGVRYEISFIFATS
jgi:hypothetical protein